MLLLFACVFQKFLGDGARMNTPGHEIVALVSQHTYNLRRKRFVKNLDRGFSVAAVSRRYGTVLDMLARALAQCLYIGEKWRVFQSFSLVMCGSSGFNYIQHESCPACCWADLASAQNHSAHVVIPTKRHKNADRASRILHR